MNLNELIKKYEEQIKLREKQILYIEGTELDFLVDDSILIYQKILKDLEELKDEILNITKVELPEGYIIIQSDFKEIIGVDTDE